jgi:hypothetical protein
MENKTKHTPTPWNLHPDYKGKLFAVGGGDVPFVAAELKIAKGKKIIGEVTLMSPPAGYPHVESEEEFRANGEFIVQAVNAHADLLAALHFANDVIDKLDGFSARHFRKLYAAAIAKAEGGAEQ